MEKAHEEKNMLQSLHVKNLALMEETEVEFSKGLNILTGETGAGKSLLIGSINLALGAKFEKDLLRSGAESALVELVFDCNEESVIRKMRQMDLEPEENLIVISRKMQPGKSICKINGETVTAKQLKELAEVLLDIHGQHEHQSLLHKRKHMEILDAYCGAPCIELGKETAAAYDRWRLLKKKISEETVNETEKAREQSLAEFELQEIAEAGLQPGEDEELEQAYRRMSNSQKISEYLGESYRYSGMENAEGAGNSLSRSLKALRNVTMYDTKLETLEKQLSEVDSLLADYNREISDYLSECEFDEQEFNRIEQRLNIVNHLKGKYGSTIEDILAYGAKKQEQLEKYLDYDAYIAGLQQKCDKAYEELLKKCRKLSDFRKANALLLEAELKAALIQLNFLSIDFKIEVRAEQEPGATGFDDVEFLISTNPGETVKPLGQVASGGELSRVMLAIKTVLAGKDTIDTLIFDEIDTGISGRTAWKVAGQLHTVSCAHQVICITHLPQIAAMADTHFVIEKRSEEGRTITEIRKIDEQEQLAELARLLGSDVLTQAALSNAKELREQAQAQKKSIN